MYFFLLYIFIFVKYILACVSIHIYIINIHSSTHIYYHFLDAINHLTALFVTDPSVTNDWFNWYLFYALAIRLLIEF